MLWIRNLFLEYCICFKINEEREIKKFKEHYLK